MRNPKYHIYLTSDERRTVINSLSFRLSLTRESIIPLCRSWLLFAAMSWTPSLFRQYALWYMEQRSAEHRLSGIWKTGVFWSRRLFTALSSPYQCCRSLIVCTGCRITFGVLRATLLSSSLFISSSGSASISLWRKEFRSLATKSNQILWTTEKNSAAKRDNLLLDGDFFYWLIFSLPNYSEDFEAVRWAFWIAEPFAATSSP